MAMRRHATRDEIAAMAAHHDRREAPLVTAAELLIDGGFAA
jgi:hypothetical protein